MVFGDLLSEEGVFRERKKSVRDVLVDWHAAAQGPGAEHPRGEHAVVFARGYHRGHRGYQPGRVLVVRVDHHDDVRPELQGLGVAGLLVAAVALVLLVDYDVLYAELPANFHRIVRAAVVHKHDLIDNIKGDIIVGHDEGLLGMVGGHYDDDLFSVQHRETSEKCNF